MCKCIEGILRFILFIFNVALAVAGIALIVVGGVVAAEFGKFAREELFEQRYLFGVVGISIFAGILLLIVGVFGIGGLCCKNGCMLKTFVVFLLVLIILEIVICVLVFVYRDEGEKSAQTTIRDVLGRAYNDTSNTRTVLDELQRDFDCCGGFNISDYTGISVIENGNVTRGIPPSSCCRLPDCRSLEINPTNFYFDGCGTKLFDRIGKLGIAAFVIAIIFLVLQIIGLFLACKFIKEEGEGKSV